MNSISKSKNPYASPRTQVPNADAEEVLLEIRMTLFDKLLCILCSALCIGGALLFTQLLVTDPLTWATTIPVVVAAILTFSALCYWMYSFERQVYTNSGIWMSDLTGKFTRWNEIA